MQWHLFSTQDLFTGELLCYTPVLLRTGHTRVLLLRGAASAKSGIWYAFFLSNCLSRACSLPEVLAQPRSKPRASGGGWTPSVYPLKYVLGFQVNVCDFFPYMNKLGFDFFFFKNELQKNCVVIDTKLCL